MAYKVEELPGEPVVLVTFEKEFEFGKHGSHLASMVKSVLDKQEQPVFFINDMVEATWRFEDVVAGANLVTRETSLFQHPMIRENIFVTRDSLVALSTKGLDSSPFGNVKIQLFQTLENALRYVRDIELRDDLSSQKTG